MLHIKQRKTGHPFFWYVVEKRTKWDILYNFFSECTNAFIMSSNIRAFYFPELDLNFSDSNLLRT